MSVDEKVQELVDEGFCTHYPGYTCDEDWPDACPECIRQWLTEREQEVRP